MSAVSTGACEFCGGVFSKRGIKRHLDACPNRLLNDGGKTLYYTLQIQGYPKSAYWVYVEMRATALLAELDGFLRGLWLECCGHLSMFSIDRINYLAHDPDGWEENMDIKLQKVVQVGDEFTHEYDFGSTTTLKLKVVSERRGVAKKEAIELLARNTEPEMKCHFCSNSARYIDGACGHLACSPCMERREKEELDDYWLLLVNSPRTGVCGYQGD